MLELNDDIPLPGPESRSLDHLPISNHQEISIPPATRARFYNGALGPLRANLKYLLGSLGQSGHGNGVEEMEENHNEANVDPPPPE
jgi:hypothetical protein